MIPCAGGAIALHCNRIVLHCNRIALRCNRIALHCIGLHCVLLPQSPEPGGNGGGGRRTDSSGLILFSSFLSLLHPASGGHGGGGTRKDVGHPPRLPYLLHYPPGPCGKGGRGKRMNNSMYGFLLGGCGAELNLLLYCNIMVLIRLSYCIRIEMKRK